MQKKKGNARITKTAIPPPLAEVGVSSLKNLMKKQFKTKKSVECNICNGYECVNIRKQYETCADCPVMVFGLNPKNKINTLEN